MIRRLLRRMIDRTQRSSRAAAPAAPRPAPVETLPEEHQDEDEDEPPVNVEIDTAQLKAWIDAEHPFTLVDIREPHELRQGHAACALLLRMNDIPERMDELPDPQTRLVIYCAAGSRSYGVAHWLREQGWEDSWSLESGIHGVLEAGFEMSH